MDRSEITKEAISRLQLKVVTSSYKQKDIPCHCPFHEDKTPSLFINPSMGVYHCFSCGKQGSVEGLFRDLTGQSLSKILNLNYDDFSSATWKTFKVPEEQFDTLGKRIAIELAGDVAPIRSSPTAVSYLRRRGIPYTVADAMKMRVATKARINGTLFEQRLLIPIYEQQQLISLEGRDLLGTQKPKVLYPKASTVNTLYDLDKLQKHEPLYIVEGLMDLAVLRSAPEFANSTTVFGASITKRQLYLLDTFDEVILIPDNDEPGLNVIAILKEGLQKAQVYKLQVPSLINSVAIKDVGDVHSKTAFTISQLVQRKWLKMIRKA